MKKHKNVGIKPEIYQKVVQFSQKSGISITNLTSKAVDYYIDNNIHLKELKKEYE